MSGLTVEQVEEWLDSPNHALNHMMPDTFAALCRTALAALSERGGEAVTVPSPPAAAPAAPEAMVLVPENKCRDDGRCQYAIDHDAESLGNCHPDKCKMPGQQRLDDEAVGREWRTNSSLEQWFPCTAQHLKDLTEQVELLRAPACPDAGLAEQRLFELAAELEGQRTHNTNRRHGGRTLLALQEQDWDDVVAALRRAQVKHE